VTLHCDSCAREWTAPRDIPDQPALKLRGEVPDDAPAGRCPACGRIFCVSCARPFLKEGRFLCRDCGERLDLKDDHLRYILRSRLELPG